MPATKNADNVQIGFANGYIAPSGTSGPADTVELNGDWGSTWYHYGFTDEGMQLNWERDSNDHFVEEQSLKIFTSINQSSLTVAFNMAETTMENLKYAMGGGTLTTVAAGTGIIGKKTLVLSAVPTEYAFGFEYENVNGFWERIVIPRGLFLGSLEVHYRRAEDKRVYTAEFHAACLESEISIKSKTAAAL